MLFMVDSFSLIWVKDYGMKKTMHSFAYPNCKCANGQKPNWEHLNETCISTNPFVMKVVGIILLILAIICCYEAVSIILYIENALFFWGMLVSTFTFAILGFNIIRTKPTKEITIRCKNCKFETTINYKEK